MRSRVRNPLPAAEVMLAKLLSPPGSAALRTARARRRLRRITRGREVKCFDLGCVCVCVCDWIPLSLSRARALTSVVSDTMVMIFFVAQVRSASPPFFSLLPSPPFPSLPLSFLLPSPPSPFPFTPLAPLHRQMSKKPSTNSLFFGTLSLVGTC